MYYLEEVFQEIPMDSKKLLKQNTKILDMLEEKIIGTVASNKFWSSMSFQNLVELSQI
jgi:hypothetical protein